MTIDTLAISSNRCGATHKGRVPLKHWLRLPRGEGADEFTVSGLTKASLNASLSLSDRSCHPSQV
ncbi:hypothetical protein GCM10022420_069140 [Streptomyces iranensis]